MKQKIILGVLVTSIFLTIFTSSVMASEGETATNITVLDDSASGNIITEYDNYVVFKHGNIYNVFANIDSATDSGIEMGNIPTVYKKESLTSIEEVIEALESSTLEGSYAQYFTYSSVRDNIIYSSHDVYYGGAMVFQQAPLMTEKVGLTVGKMTPHQIVTATTKQMVGLVPCMIALLVGCLAFRKGLAVLFRVLVRA